jgi:hypothetical protein
MSDLDDNVEQSQKLHIGRAVSVSTGAELLCRIDLMI